MREGVEEREPPPLHVQLQGGRGAGRRDPTTEERTDGRTDGRRDSRGFIAGGAGKRGGGKRRELLLAMAGKEEGG